MVMQLPDGDQTSMSRKQMLARLDIAMGGRVAEELIFGEDNVTSGASNDFQQATRLARAMVTKWGFSSKLGIQYNGDPEEKLSSETQAVIDNEVRQLLSDSYARAKKMLTENRRELDNIANALIEHETLSGSEVKDVAQGKRLNVRNRSQEPSRPPVVLPASRKMNPTDKKGSGSSIGEDNLASSKLEKDSDDDKKEKKKDQNKRGPPSL